MSDIFNTIMMGFREKMIESDGKLIEISISPWDAVDFMEHENIRSLSKSFDKFKVVDGILCQVHGVPVKVDPTLMSGKIEYKILQQIKDQ